MCGWGGPDSPMLLRWHLEENIWACCICSGYVSWLQQCRQSKALCSMTDLKSGSSISAQQQKIQFSPKWSNSKHNLNSVIFLQELLHCFWTLTHIVLYWKHGVFRPSGTTIRVCWEGWEKGGIVPFVVWFCFHVLRSVGIWLHIKGEHLMQTQSGSIFDGL